MLFHTFHFVLFFFLLIITLVSAKKVFKRKLILLLFSYIFYMWWNPAFILLIIFSTIIDYFLGKRLHVEKDKKRRKQILLLSIFSNLGILFFFKYANFFEENLLFVMRLFGSEPSWVSINITLPVGISFYTFQTMSYTIDLYNEKIKPCYSITDFALFVSFFPQLVAGPIIRARDFLPQLNKETKLCWELDSLFLIMKGLFKKVIIADNIAIFSDMVFDNPIGWNSTVIWVAALFFYVRIYCDFSGYSDIAIGLAKILGFDLSINFNKPYFAKNISEFWQKWHISLSLWLRDYLYIPLGGNRSGLLMSCRNVLITMILGGLWHGASWNFIIWGLLHGLALILHRLWRVIYPKKSEFFIYATLAFLITQLWFIFTWIFFRVKDLDKLSYCLKKFIFFDFNFQFTGLGLGSSFLLFNFFLALIFYILHLYSYWIGGIEKRLAEKSPYFIYFICFFLGVIFFILWPTIEKPFIYFQF